MSESSKFHFIEINWVLYFPSFGNEGREYPKYGVAFRDRQKSRSQDGRRISLRESLDEPDIKENYPHTVAYYVKSTGKGTAFTPSYKEKRTIRNVEEFYKFLRDLNL